MASQVLELTLPEGINLSATDMEIMSSLLQVLITMRFENGHQKRTLLQTIEKSGWNVKLGVSWVAEARRGQDFEQAIGKSPVSALCCLHSHTQMAKLEGCP